MKRFLVIPAAAALVLLAACDDPNAKPQPASTQAPAQAPALTDQDLAVQADFEEDAEKAISSANYKQELDAVEVEVNGT